MEEIYYFENLEQIHAIGEPTRWHMLDLLIADAMTGSQLARALGIPRPLAHYHLKILEKVGLVAFQEKRLLGGVVEIYFRAIARQYRTDHLVDHHRRDSHDANGGSLETGEAIRELMKAMIEIARADISQPEAVKSLTKMGFNYQDDLHLTTQQMNEFILTMRDLGDRYVKLSQQNVASTGSSTSQELIHLRYTWLHTPPAVIKTSSETKNTKLLKK